MRNVPLVALLDPGNAQTPSVQGGFAAFKQGLHAHGHVEGKTDLLEWRHANFELQRLPALAAELVRLSPTVIVTNTNRGVLAAKGATTSIPIVAAVAGDLLGTGSC